MFSSPFIIFSADSLRVSITTGKHFFAKFHKVPDLKKNQKTRQPQTAGTQHRGTPTAADRDVSVAIATNFSGSSRRRVWKMGWQTEFNIIPLNLIPFWCPEINGMSDNWPAQTVSQSCDREVNLSSAAPPPLYFTIWTYTHKFSDLTHSMFTVTSFYVLFTLKSCSLISHNGKY